MTKDKCKGPRAKLKKADKNYNRVHRNFVKLRENVERYCNAWHPMDCPDDPDSSIWGEDEKAAKAVEDCKRMQEKCLGAYGTYEDFKDDDDAAYEAFEDAKDALSDCEHKKKKK